MGGGKERAFLHLLKLKEEMKERRGKERNHEPSKKGKEAEPDALGEARKKKRRIQKRKRGRACFTISTRRRKGGDKSQSQGSPEKKRGKSQHLTSAFNGRGKKKTAQTAEKELPRGKKEGAQRGRGIYCLISFVPAVGGKKKKKKKGGGGGGRT